MVPAKEVSSHLEPDKRLKRQDWKHVLGSPCYTPVKIKLPWLQLTLLKVIADQSCRSVIRSRVHTILPVGRKVSCIAKVSQARRWLLWVSFKLFVPNYSIQPLQSSSGLQPDTNNRINAKSERRYWRRVYTCSNNNDNWNNDLLWLSCACCWWQSLSDRRAIVRYPGSVGTLDDFRS